MDRRGFLTAASGIVIGLTTPNNLLSQVGDNGNIHGGWVPNRGATVKFKSQEIQPFFSQQAAALAGSGEGKRAFLWKYFEKTSKSELIPHDQASYGDCVSHSYALGIDILDSVQISHGKGSWRGKVAPEIIYTGGRIEIAKGELAGDGMHGSWAARWCRDYGALLRKPYLNGKYDFSRYSGSKARKWAHICKECTEWGGGVPDELEALCKKHPVRTVTLVKSWEEARDAIYNGYPVSICSDQGFKETERDKDGFAEPKYGRMKKWYHSMILAGFDDSNKRPGGLFINSWGSDWITGPTRFGQPKGSFWADAKVIDSMLKYEDSFAMSNYIGYPRQHLDYKLY